MINIFGPKVFIRIQKNDTIIDLFGDYHSKLTKNTFTNFIQKQYCNYDKICLEYNKPNLTSKNKINKHINEVQKISEFLLNSTFITLLNLIIEQKINKNKVIFFDNRVTKDFPLPLTNDSSEWKIFLKKSKIDIFDKIVADNNTVNLNRAFNLLENIAMNEVRQMDKKLIDTLIKKKVEKSLVICGLEHVLDILCLLAKHKFKIVYINEEYSKNIKRLDYEINNFDYIKERREFKFDDFIEIKNKSIKIKKDLFYNSICQ